MEKTKQNNGIGSRIRERRKQLNMSVDELAEKINVNRATVYRYEKGEINTIPADILPMLAESLSTSTMYLIGKNEMEEHNIWLADITLKMLADFNFFKMVKNLYIMLTNIEKDEKMNKKIKLIDKIIHGTDKEIKQFEKILHIVEDSDE